MRFRNSQEIIDFLKKIVFSKDGFAPALKCTLNLKTSSSKVLTMQTLNLYWDTTYYLKYRYNFCLYMANWPIIINYVILESWQVFFVSREREAREQVTIV